MKETIIKEEALRLRRNGTTHREIAKRLKVSVGSAHLWTKTINLSLQQKIAIHIRAQLHAFTPERRAKLSDDARVVLLDIVSDIPKKISCIK